MGLVIRDKIRAALLRTMAIDRLLVDHETVNPDVITPTELNAMIDAVMDVVIDETRPK